MKELNLSKNKISLLDDEDYEKVISSPYKWYAIKSRNTYYGYGQSKGIYVLLHRFIMEPENGLQIDHINRDGLDNRRENLRIVTNAENQINKATNNSSGYRGVWLCKDKFRSKCWSASITISGKRIKLGRYSTAKEAAIAYNEAATKYFGNIAILNDI